MSRFASLALAAALLATAASSAGAQAVTGLGEDATTVGARRVRVWIGSDWSLAQDAYTPDGNGAYVLRPLGAALTLDTLGATQIGAVRSLQDSLRAAAGTSAVTLSLGRSTTRVSQTINHVPLSIEAGLARWLSVSATIPLVHTISDVFFNANVTGSGANVGANPARSDATAFATDTSLVQQLTRSAAAIASYCAGAGAGSSACAGSAALVSSTRAFSGELGSVYVNGGLAPTQTSGVQSQIDARVASVKNAVNAFAAIAGSGVPAVSATGVVGAATPVTTTDVQTFLSDPTLGTAISPVQTLDQWHLGDAELNAKVTLFDSFALRGESRFSPHGFNLRAAVSGGLRFPTGRRGSPDVVFDAPQAEHTSALLVGGYVDVLVGRHLWGSLVAHYVHPRASDIVVRTALAGEIIPLASDTVTLSRTLGSVIEIDATPRWVVNDFFSFGGVYSYIRRDADSYAGVAGLQPSGSLIAPLPAGFPALDAGTMVHEHRIGGGVVFSNAHAVAQGRSNIPFDVSYEHLETVRVTAGAAPKYVTDQILVRLYYGRSREKP